MSALGLCLLTAVAMASGAPWWLVCVLAMPALMLAPGIGWARWAEIQKARIDAQPGRWRIIEAGGPPPPKVTGLQLLLDATWISMGATWIGVAVVRELGLSASDAAWALLGGAAAFGALGSFLGRKLRHAPSPRRELLGGVAVLVAVILSATWRHADLVRPLDGYWWLADADAEGHEVLPLSAGEGWAEQASLGWPEARAMRLDLPDHQGPVQGTLVAEDAAEGRLILAVRGPLGSTVRVGEQVATVQASVMEAGEERPVRRYLDRGVAGLAVPVDLAAGQSLTVEVDGDALYVFPGTESVWSAHAAGELRYTHYWQILNQVENLDWANEVLDWRWFTLNQPPGWSPLLATTLLFGDGDLPANNLLFLFVLLVVGCSGVRLASLVGRGAPLPAWFVPGGLVAVHALLMFEPGSTNFPDSLYAAAVVGVAGALAGRRMAWFALLGIIAGLLRWPGVIVATMLALTWWGSRLGRPWRGLLALWGLVLFGALGTAALVTSGALRELGDLLFVLYFETFPEHWHGDYDPSSLLSRPKGFYSIWLRYTGGGIGLALLGLFGRANPARCGTRFVVAGALFYSLLLCTIDHHPTHYFLPLVALTGPAVVAASAAMPGRPLKWALPLLTLLGLWTTLSVGQVF